MKMIRCPPRASPALIILPGGVVNRQVGRLVTRDKVGCTEMSGGGSWMAAALERLLPPNLRENADIYKRTQDALTEAKIGSEAELLSMTRDQIKAANVPVAARPYLCVKREEPPRSISTALPSPAVDVTTEISVVSDQGDVLPFCGDGLHGLVNAGDVAAIKELHASLPAAKWERALCEMNEQQDTVLSLALRSDNLAVVSLLLELGAARSVFVHRYRSRVLVCTLPFKTTPPAAIGHASTASEHLAGRSPTPSSHNSKLLALLDHRLESYITDLASGDYNLFSEHVGEPFFFTKRKKEQWWVCMHWTSRIPTSASIFRPGTNHAPCAS